MAIKAGVRELKSRLSSYLSMVKSGKTVMITEHGKVIGYLTSVAPSLEERMRALEAAGLLRRAQGKLPLMYEDGYSTQMRLARLRSRRWKWPLLCRV